VGQDCWKHFETGAGDKEQESNYTSDKVYNFRISLFMYPG
jgi:hypothetical protein